MQDADTISIIRKDARTVLAQIERAQADAAALRQWYTSIGGATWINGVDAATWTAAGITKAQLKKALDDLRWFASIYEGAWTNGADGAGGNVWTSNDLAQNLYRIQTR